MMNTVDTGRASLLHCIFPSKPGDEISALKHYVIPYLSSALITYGVLFVLAAISLPTLATRSAKLVLPFLLDFNVAWMFLISLPVMVVFLVTERITIPDGIGKIIASGVLEIQDGTAGRIVEEWEKRYRLANIVGQLGGVFMGVAVSYSNYAAFTQKGFGAWPAQDGHPYFVSWYYILCMAIFYFVVSVSVVRSFTTVLFLRDVVKQSRVEIIPFHPDRCGGLGPVGRIGLRNQYLLSIIGANVVLLLMTFFILGSNASVGFLLILAALGYLIIGPISFMGPLLPFRSAMQRDKSRLIALVAKNIKGEFKRITKLIDEGNLTDEDQKSLTRYQKVGELVAKLPIWPFDTVTLRKFFSAYLFPLISVVLSFLLQELIKRYLIGP